MTFTIEDIKDRDHLEFLIREESFRIFNSPKARKGRAFSEILDSVRISKTAEYYLVEQGHYNPAKDIYHDLVDGEGNFIEVKAYNVYNSNAPHVKSELERIRESTWNQSKWMILFKYNQGSYTFLEKIFIKD
jgi:hypothetical protein